jgi:hypothetical protein
VARARDGEVEQKSQPISLEAQMGSRVMLVFPLTGAGAPDGQGRPDKSLAPGTIVVRAEDGTGQALEGLEVILAHAKQGEAKPEELHGKTDVAGEATWKGLDHAPTSGYLAVVVANGVKFSGKPFRLDATSGARVVLQVTQVSHDLSALSLGEGSHFLVEITDDSLQVIEVLRLRNAGTAAVDPGPEGLHIPLPREAVSLQAGDSNPALSIAGHDAVYKAPIPPGDTQLRVGFNLPHRSGRAELAQATPVPFLRVALITQKLDGLNVSGHEVEKEERDMQGRKLLVFLGGQTARDGELRLSFTGLPAADPTARYIAAGLAILLVLVFGLYAAGGDGSTRARLERERQELISEIARIDAAVASGDDSLVGKRRAQASRLAQIYRGLDELGGG